MKDPRVAETLVPRMFCVFIMINVTRRLTELDKSVSSVIPCVTMRRTDAMLQIKVRVSQIVD